MAKLIATPAMESLRMLHGTGHRSLLPTVCVISACALAGAAGYTTLLTASNFVCLRTPSIGRIQSFKSSARVENDAAVETQTKLMPDPPESIEEMTKQAADAAMAAYRDGITRQTVQLRLDVACTEA